MDDPRDSIHAAAVASVEAALRGLGEARAFGVGDGGSEAPTGASEAATRGGGGASEATGPIACLGAPGREALNVPARRDPYSRALYEIRDIAAAMGCRGARASSGLLDENGFAGDPAERVVTAETEQQRHLADILEQGEPGRWRCLARPTETVVAALDRLDRKAPHFADMTGMVRRHLLAQATIGLPIALPRTMLLGAPGVGKTWYLSRLAGVLGIPFRHYPMNGSTLGEGLFGAHPSWRNAQPGLIAKTLLREAFANPLVLVDEFDKAPADGRDDCYRPFYTLLEPAGAKAMVDEYLQFPLDCSAVLWVMAGNSLEPTPDPIVDRLTVLEIPPLGRDTLKAVAGSVYADANEANLGFFDADLPAGVLDTILRLAPSPRLIRIALEDAMVTAAAERRSTLRPGDVRIGARDARRRIGF